MRNEIRPNTVGFVAPTFVIARGNAFRVVKDVIHGRSNLRVQSCHFWTGRAWKDVLVDGLQVQAMIE